MNKVRKKGIKEIVRKTERQQKRARCEKCEPQHLYEPPKSRCPTGARTVISVISLKNNQ